VAARVRNPLLAERDGRLVFAIQLCDTLAFGLGIIALPYLVLQQTGSEPLSGLTAAFGTLPYVLFGLLAGVAGDRLPRKQVLIVSYAGKAIGASTIPIWAALNGHVPLGIILGAAFIVGVGRSFTDAAVFGAVAEIVTPERFVEGQAVLTLAWSTGQVLGPIGGGVLLAALGGADVIAVQAALFVAGSLLVLLLRIGTEPAQTDGSSVTAMAREGLHVVFSIPILRMLTLTGFVWFLCIGGAQAMLVAYYKVGLGFDKRTLATALALAGLSGGACALFTPALSRRFGVFVMFAFGTGITGVAMIGLASARGQLLAYMWAIMYGAAMQIGITMLVSERQRHAGWHLQSRVGISGRMVSLLGISLGGFTAAGLSSLLPLRAVYAGAGLLALTVTAIATPRLRRTASAPTAVEAPELREARQAA
jgi:MFS family permease